MSRSLEKITPQVGDYIEELRWRGLLHQSTDEEGLRKHLSDPGNSPRRAYAGFDPTADSLTIGNLVPIMMLVHLRRAGHDPVVLMGGGTGLIGDPSGKSAERQLMTRETVEGNVRAQRGIFDRVFANSGLTPPGVVNNADWLCELRYLEVLRDVGKHFSVNMMIQKDSVRERLNSREQGISYTEFSYMILQAYDFLHLYRDRGVTLQIGGSDQYGNILGGCDLIRRSVARYIEMDEAADEAMEQLHSPNVTADNIEQVSAAALSGVADTLHVHIEHGAFGLTAPLVTKADGGKFGKTESGAIWLSEKRDHPDSKGTSAYDYYQFWLNASDADAIKFLKIFTLLSRDEIGVIEASHAANPSAREAQRTLAREATRLLHGESERDRAEAAARALFSGDIAGLDARTLDSALSGAPSTTHDKSRLSAGVSIIDLLVETQLATSKRQAREFLEAGSVAVNGRKVGVNDAATSDWLLHGSVLAIRRGKKNWHVTRWT